MPTIVEQIQRDALDPTIPVSSLLRRVKVAAVKLGLEEVEAWVGEELNGYKGEVPSYRIMKGTPKAFNPYNGWIPFSGLPSFMYERGSSQSMAEIEDILTREGDEIQMPYPPDTVKRLDSVSSIPFGRYSLSLDRSQVAGIPDRVRTLVLDWALNLEKSGVTGTEFSFSAAEKEIAKEAPMTISIGNIGSFAGNLGNGNQARDISLEAVDLDQVKQLVSQLKPQIATLEDEGADRRALEQILNSLAALSSSEDPDKGSLKTQLRLLKDTLSGAAGSLVASGALTLIAKIFGG